MSRLSLKKKLMLVFLGLNAIFYSILLFMVYQSHQSRQVTREEKAKASAFATIEKIDRNLFERFGDVQAFALSESARSGDPYRIEKFINDMMVTYAPVYDLMMVTNASGEIIAANTIKKDGTMLKTDHLLGLDMSEEHWFKEASKPNFPKGTSVVEDSHYEELVKQTTGTDGYVMNFSVPILDPSTGTFLGVWTNRMSWKDVVEEIIVQEQGRLKGNVIQESFAFLLDSKGRYLVRPPEIKEETHPNFVHMGEHDQNAFQLSHLKPNQAHYSDRVIEVVVPSLGFASYPGVSWHMVIQVPEMDPDLYSKLWMLLGTFLVLFIVSVSAVVVIQRSLLMLGTVSADVGREAKIVQEAGIDISAGSSSLAQAATEQASALQETAASVEEMSAMIKKSSENAQSSFITAKRSYDSAKLGQQSVRSMIHAIGDINVSNEKIMEHIRHSNERIKEIIKVITEIGSKTKVINEIVFQTKLLSFNASVEAARAGEHGKGFAVVAEEVGSLAQMSGSAAKEISDMLSSSIEKVENIIQSTTDTVGQLIQDGKQKVAAGSKIAEDCGRVLEDVVEQVSEVSKMVSEITSAAHEQSIGIAEINRAMNQLDQVTHENSQIANQSAANAGNLAHQADSLLQASAQLREVIFGAHSSALTGDSHKPTDGGAGTALPAASSKAKVIAFRQDGHSNSSSGHASASSPASTQVKQKMVVGGERIPTENDPRFIDL